jgi:hypothetical protein
MLSIALIAVPIAAYFSIFFFLWIKNKDNQQSILVTGLRCMVLWTVYLTVCLEALSLVHAVTQIGLLLAWLLLVGAIIGWTFYRIRRDRNLSFPRLLLPDSWENRICLGIIGFTCLVTFIVALLTPPQTWDSLSYHLSRVAHWAQNQSISHYISGIERQNSMSPGAEWLVLNMYVLTQGDRFANFPQWFAMIGSLLGVGWIAGQLSKGKYAPWIAAAFAATLPIGIVESSSTATDYVATLWVVILAVETVLYSHTRDNRSVLFSSLAAGLAILTKPIVVPYILPFAIWIGFSLLRHSRPKVIFRWSAIAVGVFILINAGYLGRNISTFGSLSNPIDFSDHVNQLRTLPGIVSSVTKHASLHAGFPNDRVNYWISQGVLWIHYRLHVDIMDPRSTGGGYFGIRKPSTQEDLTSNPFHALVILITTIVMILIPKKVGWKTVLYGGLVIFAFILYCSTYKWLIFSVRYHLPFFLLISPIIGVVWGIPRIRWSGVLIVVLLTFHAIPWLFSINSRPIVANANSMVRSIFSEPRDVLYYANELFEMEIIGSLVQPIRQQGCQDIGIMLYGEDPEYLYWAALGNPSSHTRIEWIVAGTPSARYEPDDFHPCAIICEGCQPDQSEIRGLPFFLENINRRLYLQKNIQ